MRDEAYVGEVASFLDDTRDVAINAYIAERGDYQHDRDDMTYEEWNDKFIASATKVYLDAEDYVELCDDNEEYPFDEDVAIEYICQNVFPYMSFC